MLRASTSLQFAKATDTTAAATATAVLKEDVAMVVAGTGSVTMCSSDEGGFFGWCFSGVCGLDGRPWTLTPTPPSP